VHAVEFFFDDDADAAVRRLWQRLDEAGVPSLATRGSTRQRRHRPHVTFAMAGSIPRRTVAALRTDLRLLSLPSLWLYTLGTFPTRENVLWLGAIADTELLAVHSAVHDALAGAVRQPSAYFLPGSWVPHCTLAQDLSGEQLAAGLAALHPVAPVRAKVIEVGITDTRTGEVDLLMSR
jgi:2'-5' RNA ligase